MGNTTSLSPLVLKSLDATASAVAKTPAPAPTESHPADVQAAVAVDAMQAHFRSSIGLGTRVRIDNMDYPQASPSILVVADFRCYNVSSTLTSPTTGIAHQAGGSGAGSTQMPPPTVQSAYKSALRGTAMSIACALEQHRASVSVLALVSEASASITATGVASELMKVLSSYCTVASPEMHPVDHYHAFVSDRRAAPSSSVFVLPPVNIADLAFDVSLVATVSPAIDVLVFDAPCAIYEAHEAIGRLPTAVGMACYGFAAAVEFDALAKVVTPPRTIGSRILLAGLVDHPTKVITPLFDHVGRSESRLDHICCLFDVIVLVGHAPLDTPGMSDLISATERRGVRVIRAVDVAVPDETGSVIDRPVAADDPWPRGPNVLGVGRRTVQLMRSLVTDETARMGSVSLTILGTFTTACPCEGLRDIALSCHKPGLAAAAASLKDSGASKSVLAQELAVLAAQPSRVTIISHLDFMALRAQPRGGGGSKSQPSNQAQQAGGGGEASERVALARLPPTFNAEFARITIPPSRAALWLCGSAPSQLLTFPESLGLTGVLDSA